MTTKTKRRTQASPHLQELQERERVFLERARAGADIRDEVVLSLQPIIERMASRLYARQYSHSHIPAVEVGDLVQEAYARMLALFPKALEQQEPFRWLIGTAHGAMRDQLNGPGDSIKRHPRQKPVPILRLDRPLMCDGSTLADILPDTSRFSPQLPKHMQTAIERAIATLPEKQRVVILHCFGFSGTSIPLNQIGRKLYPNSTRPNSTYQYKCALAALRQALSDTFQQPNQAKVAGGARS